TIGVQRQWLRHREPQQEHRLRERDRPPASEFTAGWFHADEANAGVGLGDERLETEPPVFGPMEATVSDQTHENPIADLNRNTKQLRRLRKSERRSRHLVELVPDTMNQRPAGAAVAPFGRQRGVNRFDRELDDLCQSCIGEWWLLHGLLRRWDRASVCSCLL